MSDSFESSDDGASSEPVSGGQVEPTLSWDGDVSELFGIYIKQILLSIVTLGVYYFWGKTQVRQYLWSHVSWGEDRFRYSGTGWELFVGFLKAVVGYTMVFGLYFGLSSSAAQLPDYKFVLKATALLTLGVLFFGLYSYALYTARRYLLSRTEWRGIRFFQEGSGVTFARIRLLHGFLMIITLGLYYPWYRYRQLNYVTNNTSFGNQRFDYDGDSMELFRGAAYYLGLFCVLPIIAVICLIALSFAVTPVLAPIIGGLAGPFIVFSIIFIGFFYRAFEQRHVADNLSYRGLSFEMDHSGWEYFRLKFFNGILISISAGLLTPLAIKRSAEFLSDHLTINGSVDYETIRQQAEEGPRHDTGEGLTELFTRSVTLMGFFKL